MSSRIQWCKKSPREQQLQNMVPFLLGRPVARLFFGLIHDEVISQYIWMEYITSCFTPRKDINNCIKERLLFPLVFLMLRFNYHSRHRRKFLHFTFFIHPIFNSGLYFKGSTETFYRERVVFLYYWAWTVMMAWSKVHLSQWESPIDISNIWIRPYMNYWLPWLIQKCWDCNNKSIT